MPDTSHHLQPITALGARTAAVAEFAGLRIAENTGIALASLTARSGRAEEVGTLAQTVLGLTLPAPGLSAVAAQWAALWTAPEQWFIEAPFDSHEDIARILKDGFGPAASITEQTDAWARFDVIGSGIADVFEILCPLDLRAMAPGASTRTVIEHLGCIVTLRAVGEVSVLCPRSGAASVHHALITAARSAL